ncbi:MAG: Holliday junction branch migration protein RuvA [Clostridia bacterium]|nr:Holliday junction branch migration protein RuvA [Clostridia bacterium]
MYYYLHGELAYVDASTCVIDCAGVGYKLTVSQITASALHTKLDTKIKLFTHLSVREDGVELFGFSSTEERECFNHLISVSGVGPKVAMSILSTMTPQTLALAICTEDIKSIAKTPGIGPKSAARIVLELKDKISKDIMVAASENRNTPLPKSKISGNISEAAEALAVLGYDKSTILAALRDANPAEDVGEIVRLALKRLTK